METNQKPKSVLYKYIYKLCVEQDTTIADVARELGKAPQNFYLRLNNGKMTYNEIKEIANVLGYDFDYKFTKRVEQPKEVTLD